MKHLILKSVDVLIALFFLFTAYSSADSIIAGTELPIVGIVVGLFYLVIAFGLIRLIPWTRYLIYINSGVGLLIVIGLIGYSIVNGFFYYPLLISLFLFVLSAVYCNYRFRNIIYNSNLKKETAYFGATLVAVVGALWVASLIFPPDLTMTTMSAPVVIQR